MISEAQAPIPTGVSAYNAGTTYAVDDLVDSAAIIYISIQPANVGNTPASSPLFWTVVTDPVAHTRELTVGEIQFSVTNGKDIFIADKPEDFAAAVLKILKEKDLAKKMSKNLKELIHKECGLEKLMKEGNEVLNFLDSNTIISNKSEFLGKSCEI